MNTVKSVTMSVAVLALTGCASWFPEPEQEEKIIEPLPARTLDYGVSYIRPASDIVIMAPSYQHVVLPSGVAVSYRDDWNQEVLSQVADRIDEKAAAHTAPEDSGIIKAAELPPAEKPSSATDAVPLDDDTTAGEETTVPLKESRYVSAWRKVCEDRLDEMTDGDFFIIQTTDFPEGLADDCDERVARSRFK